MTMCPGSQTTSTEPGKSTALVEWELPVATENSTDSLTITCDPASGTHFTIGQTSVTCTALDAYGNSSSCIFYVDVKGIDRLFLTPERADFFAWSPFVYYVLKLGLLYLY